MTKTCKEQPYYTLTNETKPNKIRQNPPKTTNQPAKTQPSINL